MTSCYALRYSLFLLIVLVLLFFTFPSVSAGKVYEDWRWNLETFTAGDDIYTIVGIEDFDKIYLRVNANKSYMVELERCVRDGLDEYCYLERDWENMDIDKYERLSPAMKIQVNRLEPKITITRSLNPSEMEFNDKGVVTVKIKNTGTKEARNLQYEETLPSNVRFVSVSENAAFDGRRILWNFGRLTKDRELSFSYRVKPVKYKSEKTKGFIAYTYEGVAENVTSKDLNFKVKTPVELSTALSPRTANIKVPTDYEITVKNNEPEETVDAYVVITLPYDLKVISFPSSLTKETDTRFTYRDNMRADSEKRFKFRLVGDYTGTYNLTAQGKFFVNDKYLYATEEDQFTISVGKVNPAIYLSVNNIRSGEPFEATLVLKNQDEKTYTDINARFWSDLFDETISVDRLVPGEEYTFTKRYFSKIVTGKTTVPIEVNGTFASLSGEEFDFYTKKTLTVGPINETLTLTQQPSVNEIKKGQEYNMVVKVKNLKDDPVFDIHVDDYFPESLEVVHGKPTALVEGVTGGKEVVAYSYRVRIPYDYESNNITTVSQFSTIINGQEYAREYTKVISVLNATLPEENQTIDQNVSDTNTTNQTGQDADEDPDGGDDTPGDEGDVGESSDQDDEDLGFFGGIWQGIKDVINSIF